MQSLAAWPDEEVAQIKGVIFDVDDTITQHGKLSANAYSALWQLHDAGYQLFAVTGRPLGWVDGFAATWPVALAVGENGAGWATKQGQTLHCGYFNSEQERAAQQRQLAHVRATVHAQLPKVKIASDQPARRCDLAFDIGETQKLDTSDVETLVNVIQNEGLHTTVSSVHCHAVPGDWNKATGTCHALQSCFGTNLESQRHRYVFIGDSGNDAAAFEFFPQSVGVANVRQHLSRLPTPPRYVTRFERADGFIELASRLLEYAS